MEKSARKSTEISHFKGCGNGKNIFMVWDVPLCVLMTDAAFRPNKIHDVCAQSHLPRLTN